MASPDIFVFWELSISFSIIFITLVSIYLYVSRPKRTATVSNATSPLQMVKNFTFVFVLISLLLFYIFTIQLARESSSGLLPEVVFAIGNIVAEAFLIIYLLRNGKEESTQT